MTAPDYQPKVANPFTEDSPAGEVLDADTITLITQLGLSLGERATQLAADNAGLRAERDLLRREINERNQLITGLRAQNEILATSRDDAIRTLADTPLDALPAPDVTT